MNKHFLLITTFIIIYASIYGQSAFVRSNSSPSRAIKPPEVIKPNLEDKLAEIKNTMSVLYSNSKNPLYISRVPDQQAVNRIQNDVNIKRSDNSSLVNEIAALNTKIKSTQNQLDQEAKTNKNEQKILELEEEIRKSNIKLGELNYRQQENLDAIKKLETQKQTLEKELKGSNLARVRLQAELLELKHATYKDAMGKLKSSVDELSKRVEQLNKNLTGMKGNAELSLETSDDSTIRQICIDMGVGKGAAKIVLTDFEDPIKEVEKNLDLLGGQINVMKVVLDRPLLSEHVEIINPDIEKADEFHKKVNEAIEKMNKSIKEGADKLAKIENEITSAQGKIAEIYKKYPSSKKDKDNMEAIGGITQPLGKMGQLVPSISLLGFNNKSDENSSLVSQLKLFVGTSKEEQATFNSNYKLFIPEMSNFGFTADFGFGFIPSTKSYKIDGEIKQPIKKLGINIGTYYLSKSLTMPKDSSEFNVGTLQFKAGLQYILIGKVLSVYSNINSFFITNGVDKFQQSFNYDKKLRSFVDFGLECYLELADRSKAGGLFIDFDLGFIVAGGDVKSLVPGNDPLIPRIKISLVKGFKF